MLHGLNELAAECLQVAIDHGFQEATHFRWDSERNLFLAKLMLVVSEAGEAAEAVRKGDLANLTEELADMLIRLFGMCAALGIDIEAAVQEKHEFNKARPHKHGGKAL